MLWWTLRGLKSGNSATRRRSAAAFGAKRDPRAIEPLVAALVDEEDAVRKAAGESLERIDRQWAKSPAAKAAVMTLLPALEAEDFERRRAAARALGAIGDRRAAGALVKALRDNPSTMGIGRPGPHVYYQLVQVEAAAALVEIEEAAAVTPLIEVIRHTPREWGAIRAATAELGRLGDRVAVKPLVDLLDEGPPPSACDDIALALARLADPSAAVPLAKTLLHRTGPPLANVMDVLEKWADPATIAPLTEAAMAGSHAAVALLTRLDPAAACRALPCLGDSNRLSAAAELLRAGRVEALTVVLGALRNLDRHNEALPSCKAALPAMEGFLELHAADVADGDLRDAANLANIAIHVQDDGCGYYGGGGSHQVTFDLGRVRQLARQELIRRDPVATACAAGQWGTVAGMGEAALPALARLLTISEAAQRAGIIRTIGRIGGSQAMPPLLGSLQDENAAVRATAAHALARRGDPSTAPALVVALQDTHKDVRLAAAKALAAIGPAAVGPLQPALRNKDHAVRSTAMEVLAQIADPGGIELLAQGLHDAGSRKPAAEALGATGALAIPALQKVLHSRNWEAVKVASELLARAGWQPSDLRDRDRMAIGRQQLSDASSDALLELLNQPGYGSGDAVVLELGRRHEPRALEPLLARLESGHTGAEIEALGSIQDPRAVEALVALLQRSGKRAVGERAAAALGKSGDIRAADALIEALESAPAGRASGLLVSLLEMKPADFSEPQLRALARRRTIEIGTGQMICATGIEETRTAECSPRLSQLARQELLRRGLEA